MIPALLNTMVWAIGVVGNVIVIIVIFRTKGMRNATNILLANLAIADLMLLLFVFFMFRVVSMYPGNGICRARAFILRTMLNTSVLLVLAIGFLRYYVICQPLKARYICTKKRAYRISLLSWALGALISSGNIFVASFQNGKCVVTYDYGPAQIEPFSKYSYIIGATFAWFLVPLIILVVLFVITTRHLNGTLASSVNTATFRHHHQVFKMLATVILVFFIFQLPFRILNIIRLFVHMEWYGLNGPETILITLHSAVNPILYNLMSKTFRTGFKKIFIDMTKEFNKWGRSFCGCGETTKTRTTVIGASPV